jgi:ubiquinone/menaquinone biosynthesis C-methylase UbiE
MVAPESDPLYAVGRTVEERLRLVEQDRNFGPSTTRLFREAGIATGMRVLDVGCGAGDVAFRAAALVGPSGSVIGIDADPAVLATARERAVTGEFTNVEFVQGDLRAIAFDDPFDAIVGRLVLVYLPQPADMLQRLTGLLRPGGVLAFQELVLGTMPAHVPTLPLTAQSFQWVFDTFQRAGMNLTMGLDLYRVFLEAGLPAPRLLVETLALAGEDSPLYDYLAHTVRSVLPLAERLGVATADEVQIETLSERLRREVADAHGVFLSPPMVGAWARVGEMWTPTSRPYRPGGVRWECVGATEIIPSSISAVAPGLSAAGVDCRHVLGRHHAEHHITGASRGGPTAPYGDGGTQVVEPALRVARHDDFQHHLAMRGHAVGRLRRRDLVNVRVPLEATYVRERAIQSQPRGGVGGRSLPANGEPVTGMVRGDRRKDEGGLAGGIHRRCAETPSSYKPETQQE